MRELTGIVAAAAGDPILAERTWVLITESPEGGLGIGGHANTGSDIAQAARSDLAELADRGTDGKETLGAMAGRAVGPMEQVNRQYEPGRARRRRRR